MASIALIKKRAKDISIDIDFYFVIGLAIGVETYKGTAYTKRIVTFVLPFTTISYQTKKYKSVREIKEDRR